MSSPDTAAFPVATPDELEVVSFDDDMSSRIDELLERYPTKQAALLPVLWLCQERWGWISTGVVGAIADRLELAPAFIEGVITFYTMYHRQPKGRYLLQVCTTLSCQLCGTPAVVDHLKTRLGIDFGETTADGRFSLIDVQCLGACGEGPVVQINNDYHTQVSVEGLDELLDRLE